MNRAPSCFMRRRIFSTLAGCTIAVMLAGVPMASEPSNDPPPTPRASSAANPDSAWLQYGGPHQDFSFNSSIQTGPAWPESGPEILWRRALGEGYSGILAEGDLLYTMFRRDAQEVITSLDANSGDVIWETAYEDVPHADHVMGYGTGPRATPLIMGDHIYTVGVAGRMHCLLKSTGKIVWSHELWDELGGTILPHGYASSPAPLGDLVVVAVGGGEAGVIAFNGASGEVAWKSPPRENSYSTPLVLTIDGVRQIVCFMATAVVGLDPATGKELWEFSQTNTFHQNISNPILAEDGRTLFISSPEAGARGLRLTAVEAGMELEVLWTTRRVQFYHVSATRFGNIVYGSSGSRSPALMVSMNIFTGEILWRERGFAKANSSRAGDYLIIMAEDGELALAKPDSEGLNVLNRGKVLGEVAWTGPTLVGGRMFLRDKTHIIALNLEQEESS
jgi:outer membrane protein assembly factor BamB